MASTRGIGWVLFLGREHYRLLKKVSKEKTAKYLHNRAINILFIFYILNLYLLKVSDRFLQIFFYWRWLYYNITNHYKALLRHSVWVRTGVSRGAGAGRLCECGRNGDFLILFSYFYSFSSGLGGMNVLWMSGSPLSFHSVSYILVRGYFQMGFCVILDSLFEFIGVKKSINSVW